MSLVKRRKIYLIDEIHTGLITLFYAKVTKNVSKKGEEQKQLSKEFVRQWLIVNGQEG